MPVCGLLAWSLAPSILFASTLFLDDFVQACGAVTTPVPSLALSALTDRPERVVLSFGDRGVFVSDDGGTHWQRRSPAHLCHLPSQSFARDAVRSTEMCLVQGPLVVDYARFCSRDGGTTFVKQRPTLPAHLRVQQIIGDPARAERQLAVASCKSAGPYAAVILESRDGGAHFATVAHSSRAYLNLVGFVGDGTLLAEAAGVDEPFRPLVRLRGDGRFLHRVAGPWEHEDVTVEYWSQDAQRRDHIAAVALGDENFSVLYESFDGGRRFSRRSVDGMIVSPCNVDGAAGDAAFALLRVGAQTIDVAVRRGRAGAWRIFSGCVDRASFDAVVLAGAHLFVTTDARILRLDERADAARRWIDVTPLPVGPSQ